MSVAERVSNERVNKVGQSVGYQVRLENKQVNTGTADTRAVAVGNDMLQYFRMS